MYPTLIKRLARVGLKSDVDMAIQMTVPVLRAAAGNTYVFQFTVYVQPTGTDGTLGIKRLANAGEVTCMVNIRGACQTGQTSPARWQPMLTARLP